MTHKPEPRCRAVVLCDTIYRDEVSKKLILVGTFHVINTLELPCVHPSMALYLAMNEGKGEYFFKIVVQHVETQQEVAVTSGPLKFDDPNQLIEMNAALTGLKFTNTGRYDVQIWADDQIIGQTFFFVNHIHRG